MLKMAFFLATMLNPDQIGLCGNPGSPRIAFDQAKRLVTAGQVRGCRMVELAQQTDDGRFIAVEAIVCIGSNGVGAIMLDGSTSGACGNAIPDN